MRYVCMFLNSETEKEFPDLASAQLAAEKYCGNRRYAKPFPNEDTYLYGPGDGTTSVMVRKCFELKDLD